jgi:hypothetical protein
MVGAERQRLPECQRQGKEYLFLKIDPGFTIGN